MGQHKNGAPFTPTKALGLARIPGKHVDPGQAGLRLQVSPKLLAVWYVKTSVVTGDKRQFLEKRIGELAVDRPPDGITYFDAEQARAAAKAWLAEQRLSADEKDKGAKSKAITLENTLEDFLLKRRTKKKLPLSEATKENYRAIYRRYLQDVKNWSLVENQNNIRGWEEVVSKAQARSVAWARQTQELVSAVYSYLKRLKEVTNNPMVDVREGALLPKIKKRRTTVSTMDLPLFVKQVCALRNQHSKDAILTMLLAGLRKNAVLALRWSMVDLERGLIFVESDTIGWKGWTGMYELPAPVWDILKRRKETAGSSKYVFPARHRKDKTIDAPMTDVRGSLEIASKDCQLRATPHILRRTYASMSNVIFKDVALTADLLCHAWATPDNPEMEITLGYTINEERVRAAANRIAEVILQIGGQSPMTEETLRTLEAAAINTKAFRLVELPKGDDEDESETEQTVEALAA